MRFDHAEDLARFVEELKRETDRGLPLVGAALIDEKLLETLKAFFVAGKPSNKLLTEGNAPLGSFSSKIEACYALGLIDEFEYQEISLIRKIRNEFAHSKHGLSFQTEKIKGYCKYFKADRPKDLNHSVNDSRFRFMNSVACIVLRLYFRAAWVQKERREPKTWVTADATRWRSTEEELPPEGVTVMAMVKGIVK